MTSGEFSPHVLNLCGYVALEQNGFALPCFASSDQSNIWYVANCAIPRDHLGIVTDFQAFRSDEIVLLPSHQVRQVHVGEPWCDVFLWQGEPFVGRPPELWALLEPQRPAIVSEAPISLLDLALFSDVAEVASYSQCAFAFVNSHFGDARARQWRRDMLFRPIVVRSIQRLIYDGRLSAPMNVAREVDVIDIDEETYRVRMPQALEEKIVAAKLTGEVLGELQGLASALSINVRSELDRGYVDNAPILSPGSEANSEVDDIPQALVTEQRPADILIVLCGQAAERMAKYVRSPTWYPRWRADNGKVDLAAARYVVGYGSVLKGSMIDGPVIHLVHMRDVPGDIARYGVAIFVGSEEDLAGAIWSPGQRDILSPYLLAEDCISLLAPILPLDRPMRGLESYVPKGYPLERVYDAVIDTALARSPVRYRTRRGTMLSRIADLVVGSALLCSGENALTNFLKNHRRETIPGMLAFGLEPQPSGRQEYGADLASENTWGSTREHRRGTSTMFASTFDGISATKAKPSYGHVEIRRREVEFADFARHVVERIVSSNPRWNPNLLAEIATESIIPGSILAELEFEEYVAGFAIRSVNRQLPVVVTAETPKLSAVVAAQTEGWQIARYTDVDTLYDVFLSPASSYGPAIPLELELPGIRRLPENQHLFSRGVLKADVLMQENRRTFDYMASQGQDSGLRKYRMPPSYDKRTSISIIPRMSQERISATFKLPIDFDRVENGRLSAWTRPASGTTRFAFVNGLLPVQLVELSDNEVPHSSMYWVDGTEAAVRSLLESRIFYVWLRAAGEYRVGPTFSLRRSLEAFPIVPPFGVQKPNYYQPYLFLDGDTRMIKLAREIEALPTTITIRQRPRRILPYAPIVRDARKALDEAVLSAYGLRDTAADVDILVRLLELNDRLGSGSAPSAAAYA